MLIRYCALIAMLALPMTVLTAQDATKSAPGAYRTQFENPFVHLTRVHYGPNERLAVHEHPLVVTVYVYLNASGPVEFRHTGDGRVATRQPTTAGSFRVSRGGDEKHAVVNTTAAPSDFLRVEFKTGPGRNPSPFFRESTKTYPATENTTDVKFTNDQMRITRLIVAAGKVLEPAITTREPALIVALNDGMLSGLRPGDAATIAAGQERWLDAGQSLRLANTGAAPVELLRIDFLTAPRK